MSLCLSLSHVSAQIEVLLTKMENWKKSKKGTCKSNLRGNGHTVEDA